MTKPKRIQRKRTKGWKMPENTIYVGRPSKWGNPFYIGEPSPEVDKGLFYAAQDAAEAVNKFRQLCIKKEFAYPVDDIEELRGKNLACWCSLDQPCHADVLLEEAND